MSYDGFQADAFQDAFQILSQSFAHIVNKNRELFKGRFLDVDAESRFNEIEGVHRTVVCAGIPVHIIVKDRKGVIR